VEHIFAIPGMGRFFVFAVSNRDYPLVMGITIVYTVILVIANLLVDILYIVLDPRITFEKRRK
jgi:oligopeptide transport system permease protein